MTFFDFPNNPKGAPGTNSISRTGLRVPDDAALEYYRERFEEFGVKHDGIQELFGKKVLPFEEDDGQRYQLFSDENNKGDRKSTRLNSSHVSISYAVFCLKKKT